MKEKLKNLNEKNLPNVQVLTLEEIRFFTGGTNLQSSEGFFGTTTPPSTSPTPPQLAIR